NVRSGEGESFLLSGAAGAALADRRFDRVVARWQPHIGGSCRGHHYSGLRAARSRFPERRHISIVRVVRENLFRGPPYEKKEPENAPRHLTASKVLRSSVPPSFLA